MTDINDCNPRLQQADVDQFRQQGFLQVESIVRQQELLRLGEIFDAVILQKTGVAPHQIEQLHGLPSAGSLLTILSPEGEFPELNNMIVVRCAKRLMAQLFGVQQKQLAMGWRLFLKPGQGKETPWHQDAAYRPPPAHGASIWLPIDAATHLTSCLYYLPRSHREPLKSHRFEHGHMVAEGVDSYHAIACPINPGTALIHHCKTLHYAGRNQTDCPRRAVTLVFQVSL